MLAESGKSSWPAVPYPYQAALGQKTPAKYRMQTNARHKFRILVKNSAMRSLLLVILFAAPCSLLAQQPPAMAAEPEPEYRFSIYFGGGSAWIDPLQQAELVEFITQLDAPDLYEVTVHSHTDPIGGAEYNQWLSEERSNAALQVLQGLGIPMEKVFIKDFGMFNPVYDNATEQGRRLNRRVDILIWRQML